MVTNSNSSPSTYLQTSVGVTNQKSRFVVLVILIKQLEAEIRCFFTICNILREVATHSDTYKINKWSKFKNIIYDNIIQISRKIEGRLRPCGRDSHAACCLGFGSKHPTLLVVGGVDNDGRTLNDAWLFHVSSERWTQVRTYIIVFRPGQSNSLFNGTPGE